MPNLQTEPQKCWKNITHIYVRNCPRHPESLPWKSLNCKWFTTSLFIQHLVRFPVDGLQLWKTQNQGKF